MSFMDRSDVFIGVNQQVPTKTTGLIICTRCCARRPPAPAGTMKVRDGRNASPRRAGARGERQTPVPGSQAWNASTSNKAYPPPVPPRALLPLAVPDT